MGGYSVKTWRLRGAGLRSICEERANERETERERERREQKGEEREREKNFRHIIARSRQSLLWGGAVSAGGPAASACGDSAAEYERANTL